MTLSAEERKRWLGHGGLARVARITRRTIGHVSEVNRNGRPDPVVQRAITREIVAKNPDIMPEQVWPMSA